MSLHYFYCFINCRKQQAAERKSSFSSERRSYRSSSRTAESSDDYSTKITEPAMEANKEDEEPVQVSD